MKKRIIVAGAIANKIDSGGEAWVRMSWARGLARLGYDVEIIEQIDPGACTDDNGEPVAASESRQARYFKRVVERFGFAGKATLLLDCGRTAYGHLLAEIVRRARESSLLVNISAHLRMPEILEVIPRKALIDIDPGFTQIWHADGTARLPRHDDYFTIGANIGQEDCEIPTGGIHWKHVNQPVVLEDWPLTDGNAGAAFTTVANWRGPYGGPELNGRKLGLKVHEFRKFSALPRRSQHRYELALTIHPGDEADRQALEENGWRLVDPRSACADPYDYRSYIQSSAAEFSVAQGVYVETNSGWFSDRTIRYLASGRPALVQETGFSSSIDSGDGLVAFRTLDEAVEGAERIVKDYANHSRSARRVAEEHFDSDTVLSGFLASVGVA